MTITYKVELLNKKNKNKAFFESNDRSSLNWIVTELIHNHDYTIVTDDKIKYSEAIITQETFDAAMKTVSSPAVSEVSRLKKDHKALVRRVEDLELVLNHALTTPTPEKLKQIVNNSSVKEVAEWIRKLT